VYKAPEMEHRISPKKAADMWAMGLTALEALTGIAGTSFIYILLAI